jgi:hypothetical protein
LDETNWWGGVFGFDTYRSESLLVGTTKKVDDEDD